MKTLIAVLFAGFPFIAFWGVKFVFYCKNCLLIIEVFIEDKPPILEDKEKWKQNEEKMDDINDDQNQILKIVKDISSRGFLRSNYKKKLVDLSDIRINLKGKK